MRESYRDLFLGCARDSCVTYEVDEAMEADLEELGMRKFYRNFLMTLPDFYPEIENNGFGVNEEKRIELIEKYVEWDERLGYEMFEIAGVDVNPGSPHQVMDSYLMKWKLPRRQGTGEEELTALSQSTEWSKEIHTDSGLRSVLNDGSKKDCLHLPVRYT